MKQVFLFIFLILKSLLVFGQCPQDDVLLTNQEEVDEFVAAYGSCQVISGDLEIKSTGNQDPIVDLTGLNQLTTIEGHLIISSFGYYDFDLSETVSASLEGLENITSVDRLRVVKDPDQSPMAIQSLEPLNGISGDLTSFNLANAIIEEELPDFEGITSIGILSFSSILVEGSTPQFPMVTALEAIFVHSNWDQVSTFTTLYIPDNVVEIAGPQPVNISIEDNLLLEEIQGGASLQSAGDIELVNNPELVDLHGFSNLTSLGDLMINGCHEELFDSFQNLSLASSIHLEVNQCFGSYDHFNIRIGEEAESLDLTGQGIYLFLMEMDTVRITSPFRTVGGIEVDITSHVYYLDAFSTIDSVKVMDFGSTGNINFWEINYLNELPDFSNLTYVENDVSLHFNWAENYTSEFPDLSGFSALEKVGGLYLMRWGGGVNLTSLTGMESLKNAGIIWISGFPNLSDVSALQNLETVDQLFRLSNLPSLNQELNFSELSEMNALTLKNTGLEVSPQFPILESLPTLSVSSNDSLTLIDGFPSLINMTTLDVKNNISLEDIDLGFEIENVEVSLENNASLEMCGNSATICHLLSSTEPSDISLFGNGPECTNLNAILAQCTLGEQNQDKAEFEVYTNGNHIGVRSAFTAKADLRLFSVTGGLVFQRNIELREGDHMYSLPRLSTGIYMLELNTESWRGTAKVLIQ
jgi:hypothetical protein